MYAFSRLAKWAVLVVLTLVCFCALSTTSVQAGDEPFSCDDLVTAYGDAMRLGACEVGLGQACYVRSDVVAVPKQDRSVRFGAAGDTAALTDLDSLTTSPRAGAAYLLGGSSDRPVKIFVFGDSRLSAVQGQADVFKLSSNGATGPVCERTRSGMVLQTPTRQKGTVMVNGVTIGLGSTAYLVAGADLLFDQDPRIQRRNGERNPNAPLCSGFDSDCGFGDSACAANQRLVWGPFCRKDNYPYIENGLYRITLYGRGTVLAGATDYGASGDHFSLGSQQMDLPGSYTFCWNGLAGGGSGFETIVRAVSGDAEVARITTEYLGRDCNLPVASATAGGAPGGVMTVYNAEGSVQVSAAGATRTLKPQQRVRVYFEGDQPVAMDGPFSGSYVLGSPFARPLQVGAAGPFEDKSFSFTVDRAAITDAECANLSWDVRGVQAIYLDEKGVTGQGSQQVCPDEDTTYTLRIVNRDGSEERPTVTVAVAPSVTVEPVAILDDDNQQHLLYANITMPLDDRLDSVTFTILSDNTEIYSRSVFEADSYYAGSNEAMYTVCMFGREDSSDNCRWYSGPTEPGGFPDAPYLTNATFTLRVTVRTASGASATQQVEFKGYYVAVLI